MTRNLGMAIVIAIGLILAALLNGGFYEARVSGDGIFLWRTNRFTGTITMCVASASASPVCHDAKSN